MREYILEHNGEELELPRFTCELQDKIKDALKINNSDTKSLKEKREHLYKLECDLIGKDKTEDFIGGDLKECDPNEIQTLFIHICREYDKPIDEVNAEEKQGTMEYMGQMKGLAEEMNKVPETVKKVKGMNQ